MSYQLPFHLYIPNPSGLRVAWWDFSISSWSEHEITEVSFNAEHKIVSFKTKKLAPFAVLTSRITDYPYSYFFIRAVSQEKVLLDIKGKRIDLQFVITPGYLEFINISNFLRKILLIF